MNDPGMSTGLLSDTDSIRSVQWQDDHLLLLDQRRLPSAVRYLRLADAAETAEAIRAMAVRGAPAIGLAAAYAMVLTARSLSERSPNLQAWQGGLREAASTLCAARPTAVHLSWAVDAVLEAANKTPGDWRSVLGFVTEMHRRDVEANRRMGALGAACLPARVRLLTHCNTGSLATGGYGTALGVIRAVRAQGRLAEVFVTESRPWRQGARLTAWELVQDGIPGALIADGAAASLMQQGRIDWVVVGADRIAANGDVVNKIGTYALALAARHHGIGFMVVAPEATIDPSVAKGDDIAIEERSATELLEGAADGIAAVNPVFDVTPAALVDILVTEKGVVERPGRSSIKRLLAAS